MLGSDKKKFLWEVVDNHVVVEVNDHDEIGLWGFDINFFDRDEEEVYSEEFVEYPHLLMLIKL